MKDVTYVTGLDTGLANMNTQALSHFCCWWRFTYELRKFGLNCDLVDGIFATNDLLFGGRPSKNNGFLVISSFCPFRAVPLFEKEGTSITVTGFIHVI